MRDKYGNRKRDKYGNRKRIKLTEGELALGSWLYVTYKVITDETWEEVYGGKDKYLSAHDFPYYLWRNGCRLCDKHIDYGKCTCGRCPLKKAQKNKGVLSSKEWCGCGDNSWYDKVCYKGKGTHSERISSAINICNVLAKELKKERKMKWYGIEKGRFWFVERMLMWKAKSLYNFCRRHKLNYAEVYFLDSNGSATTNFRAKKNDEVVANGYAFVKAESKKE